MITCMLMMTNEIRINTEVASEIFKAAYHGLIDDIGIYYKRNDSFKEQYGRDSDIAQHHIKRLNEQIDKLVKLAKENNIEL